jgi:hypothetical protein
MPTFQQLRKTFREPWYLILCVQWTQTNSELELHHSKRGREDGKGKGEEDGKESV